MKIRFKFSKEGPIKYIGHLDFMRFIQKSIVRAKIPATYSKGYHPHMNLSFALPLGVGVETLGDYFDLDIEDKDHNIQNYLYSLNEHLMDGVKIHHVSIIPEEKKYNCMSSIFYASYEVCFKKNLYTENQIMLCLSQFENEKSLIITKQSKKSSQEIDIKPHIHNLKYKDSFFEMLLPTGSHLNIKPELVLQAIFKDDNLDRKVLHIKRIDMFMEDLRPMSALEI